MSLPAAEAMIILPLAGGVFGLFAAVPACALSLFLPANGVAWFAAGLYTMLGWSLHLDGWGDMWDGVGSGKRGEALRAVLKDSRVGAFGVAGIALAIGTRAALVADLLEGNPQWPLLPAACAMAAGVGRFGATVAMCLGEYPWPDGMARSVVKDFGFGHLALALVAASPLIPLWPSAWAAGIIVSSVGGAALARWASKNLGGVNGDVAGAASVLGELLSLACCASLYNGARLPWWM
jgi:adenosylcobinamide-GDP ribazoletransferase